MMVERKVARAVVALGDPDPLVEGRGFKKLEAGGVEVVVGVLEAEANESLGDYLHARRTGTPIPPVQES
jgi:diaminohydroxyphosphoribosylaminopyrimidine deaminase/5-amino-6-(5-phosphoribosylamino)uracil reductase